MKISNHSLVKSFFAASLAALITLSAGTAFGQNSRNDRSGNDRSNNTDKNTGRQDADIKNLFADPNAKFDIKAPTMEDYLFGQLPQDYTIINSNSQYIEIEFKPTGLRAKQINDNGQTLTVYEFSGMLGGGLNRSGSPDLLYRSFGVMLPSENGNTVQITDYEVNEIRGVDIAPIPNVLFANPNVRSFENASYIYDKNAEYSGNKYIPENPAFLTNVGLVRDMPTGNLFIYPVQYNPVTRNIKLYTRIRVRVTFGEAPVQLNRPRTREEISLLSGAAINSSIAMNWVSPKYRDSFKNRSVINSVLATGDWYRIEIKEPSENGQSEGMYKITKSFLEGAGINLAGVDARTIKVYGNGGIMVPEVPSMPRPEDLQELAVYFEGDGDGTFDQNDFIAFYGNSINGWLYDTTYRTYNHYINPYSRSNYYWICLNTPNNGRRMQFVNSENNAGAVVVSSFTEKIFQEPEQSNLINEGNLWLSIRRNPGSTFEWNTTLTGLEGGSDIFYRVKMAARCLNQFSHFLVKDDYSTMSEYFMQMFSVQPGFGDWIYTTTAAFTVNQSQKTNGEQVKLRATYYAPVGEAESYQDWYEILYKRRLNSTQNDLIKFDSPDTAATVEYNVSSFSNANIKVYDATVHGDVKIIQPISSSPSNVRFQKSQNGSDMSRFLVVGQNGYKTPTGISSRIQNQNLRGIVDGASFIIIAHKDFISAAERLKNKRESTGASDPNYLKTLVVTTEQVYNEFSGGVYDASALRDFIKYAFDNWQERPAHVCLLGDGSLDYKGLLPDASGLPWVPCWERTHPQINQVDGYTTDDFFVQFGGPYGLSLDKPDLTIGRIPANSLQEANDYMDKLDAYENGINNGYWKNRMLFVADDESVPETNPCESVGHTDQIEILAEQRTPQSIDRVKLYIATYPAVITPQGRRKPQANLDIARNWNDGMLNIHYTGHGSPDVWAHEYILEKDNIMSQISNENRYPFVTIASCDMSKFDSPANRSAGELFMISGRKGAIGTLAATRPVYASGNAYLMEQVFTHLYVPRDTLLLQKRFGTAMFDTKNFIGYGVNDAKYVLMSDPTLRTQMPRFHSHIDSISGLSGDTMKALSKIKIYGSIIRPDSTMWSDYNGKLLLKVYDTDRQVAYTDECRTYNFRLNGGIIYSGTQNVVNGQWVAEYIVPKDISYLNQNGRLINYFYNNQSDGAGINRNFIVGGINPDAEVDSVGPRISMFINNRNFRSGDMVPENFKFIADLFDESGINTTGTIGHKLEAVLDGNENNKYDLTNFYNSDTSYKSGTIEYDFASLPLGRHTLRLKVWDTYNNSAESEIDFNVTSSGVIQVTDVYNFPNPFKDNTSFTFHHNYPTDINIKIKIYTVAGRLIKEIVPPQPISDKFVSINWDGKDEDGETLGNGIYIYKLVVEGLDGSSVTNVGKLAVLK